MSFAALTAHLPRFKNVALLHTALTHRSALNESISPSKHSNERFEFLGDAVLELTTTQHLFELLPDDAEGNLTAFRSALVKTTTLAEVARELRLGEAVYMSKGEEAGGGRDNPSLLADTLEAVIGALFLDQGLDEVTAFLNQHLFPKFSTIQALNLHKDPKSQLQEVAQSMGFAAPTYEVTREEGPDHDKAFTVQVLVNDQVIASGTGKSKQQAQQAAAQAALPKIQSRDKSNVES